MNENLNNNNLTNKVCPICGTSNLPNTNFCIKCGNNLSVASQPIPDTNNNIPNQQPVMNNNMNNQNVNVAPTNVNVSMNNGLKMNLVQYFIQSIIKPFDNYINNESNLSDIKEVGILSGIVVLFLTIMNLLSKMISAVRVKSLFSTEVSWVWENLKNISYVKVIGTNLLVYAGILVAIAGVYFLASLVIKKSPNFVKLLGIATTSIIPFAICYGLLSPVLSMINTTIGMVVTVIGFVYSLMILIELINDSIVIENKNTRILIHVICLSILIIGGGYIIYKSIMSTITSGLGSLAGLLR